MINDGINDPESWLRSLLSEAVSEGTSKVLATAKLPEDWVTKAEAYRLYGRSQVDRWFAEGLLAPRGKQQFVRSSAISRIRLEAIAAASNRMTYLQVAER